MPEPDQFHPLYERPAAPPDASAPRKPPPKPRADKPLLTYALLVILVGIYALGYFLPDLGSTLLLQGALIPAAVVEHGQVYRLFTAMFLHASLGHIFFNAYALYIFGGGMEALFGRLRLLLIYLLGGLSGSVLSLTLGDLDGWSVGASGAVFTLFTAQALHLYMHRRVYVNVRRQLRHMLFILAINLFIGFMPGSRIDNWGHIGGMLGGLLLAWRLGPRIPLPTSPIRSIRELARTDSNPLRLHAPFLVLYVAGLAILVALVIVLRAA